MVKPIVATKRVCCHSPRLYERVGLCERKNAHALAVPTHGANVRHPPNSAIVWLADHPSFKAGGIVGWMHRRPQHVLLWREGKNTDPAALSQIPFEGVRRNTIKGTMRMSLKASEETP